MQHRIATAGWSLPGGAAHVIASWGYVSRWVIELTGPTLVRGATEALAFLNQHESVCFASSTAAARFRQAGGGTLFRAWVDRECFT